MAYQSLYRRYRPQRFADVRGQDHLVRALRNAVVEGRVGHAYLFSGPRGTGKTSTARILAKVLNCENPTDGEPCCVCESCLAIEHGSSFDVFELDAASNNGVSDIRSLIEKAALGSPGRTKVYILDEVHMLTTGASNALLKTLEEPPDHVVFVLATTDPQKVLPTIKSRTQHFDLHLLPAEELHALAEFIVKDAGLDVPADAIDYVVRAGAGSARDMESALDQVVAAGGIPHDSEAVDELVDALCERDTGRALIAVESAMNTGRTPRMLGENLIDRLRDVFLASMKADLSRLPERDQELVTGWSERMGAAAATRALEVLGDAFVRIGDAPDPRIPLEVAIVRLTKPEADHSMEAIVERLERLERGLGPIGSPPPPAPHTETHRHVDAVTDEEEAHSAAPAPVLGPDAAPAAPAAPPAGARPRGGSGPADDARAQLRSRRAGGSDAPKRATPPTRTAKADASAATASKGADAPVVTEAPAPAGSASPKPKPAPKAAGKGGAATAGTLPNRDDLTIEWGDSILPALPQRVRTRFQAARFIGVDASVARIGLPNEHYVKRCREVQADVESALEAHFGVPVPIEIVVDEGASLDDASLPLSESGRSRADARDATDAPDVDESASIDPTELVDADESSSPVDRIASVFPGVEVVDDA